MPNCSIIGCGIKRSGNHPNITLHKLPSNRRKQKIWLETIGVENLKMSTKRIHICSLHFEESSFNRTLNKITLRDDALPSRSLLPAIQTNMSGILIENDRNQTNSQSISRCGAPNKVEAVCVPTIQNKPGEISKSGIDLAPSTSATLDLVTSTSAALHLAASTSAAPHLAASTSAAPHFTASTSASSDLPVRTFEIIKTLKEKCQKQSKKIKRLNEKVRRQTKKIAHFSNIIKDLKERNLLNTESQALLAECAGQDPKTS